MQVNLHIEKGDIDLKINIEYSSKYVQIKEAYGQKNIPILLTVYYNVFLYSTTKVKTKQKKTILMQITPNFLR
jgi:hypothetical protein